jgi:hypothetical protein
MNGLNLIIRNITAVFFAVSWLAGIVLAKGFWLTTLSICLPFYSWYLVVEKVMMSTGILS